MFANKASRTSVTIIKYGTLFSRFHLSNVSNIQYIMPIIKLFDIIKEMSNYSMKISSLDDLQQRLIKCIVENEGSYPTIDAKFIVHEIFHMVDAIRKFGPVYSFSMVSFERFNKVLKHLAHTQNRPHINIINNYIVIILFLFLFNMRLKKIIIL